ncbi:hypothetical protein VTK73DRAFT_5095 [Phialemonium thermophilum]|uniref:Uncharacterized protein n=1 Tax=Phialemonium thermophilum TaxID=223376 RepID=A0ABR3WQI0_9PEZI
MTDSIAGQWTLLLSLTALLLSFAILLQTASRHAAAYFAAPREIASFLDAVDSSVAENESLDRDISTVRRLDDKFRLGRLLREIQKRGDDLREELNRLFVGGGIDVDDGDRPARDENNEKKSTAEMIRRIPSPPQLRPIARILWAGKRVELEEQLRRIDLLRMRFLVIYMGIVAASAAEAAASATKKRPQGISLNNLETGHAVAVAAAETASIPAPPPPPPPELPGPLIRSLTEGAKDGSGRGVPPLRRLTTQAIGHQDGVETPHRRGWLGVVQELQRSPLLHKRHASIELAMSQTP